MTQLYDTFHKEDQREYGGYVKADDKEYKVVITHMQGGMSYLSGETSPRGFYGMVTPIKERGNGFESFTLLGEGAGKKMLIEENSRYNKKRLAQLSTGSEGLSKVLPLLQHFGLPQVSFA